MPVQISLMAPGVDEAIKRQQASVFLAAVKRRRPGAEVELCFSAASLPVLGRDDSQGKQIRLPLFVLPGAEFQTVKNIYWREMAEDVPSSLLQAARTRSDLADYFYKAYQQFLEEEGGGLVYLFHPSSALFAQSCLAAFKAEIITRNPAQLLVSFSSSGSALAELLRLFNLRHVCLIPLSVFYGTHINNILESRQGISSELNSAGIECTVHRAGLIESAAAQNAWMQQLELQFKG
ncbi:MAG: hypothetical protein IJD04_03145 [Desulfovibrionaceae bacterium]|nr:hypothetical protein [Desulfovibrionaceae bacterium]